MGGNFELIMHLFDFQFPLFWWFRGAIFSDAGWIWPDAKSIDLGDIRYTAGPGLRLATPIGIVRFDVGFQVQRLGKSDSWKAYLDIGTAL